MARKKKDSPKRASAPAIRPPSIPPPLSAAEVADQSYELVPIGWPKLHPKNPNKGNVDAIGESIEANRFYGAILVQKSTGFILVGNHRWKSATEKGLQQIPVIVVDCDDATAERILTADNRTADLHKQDDAVLFAMLEARKNDGGLRGTGYRDADLERMKAKLSAPSEFPKITKGAVRVSYTCPNCGHKWS